MNGKEAIIFLFMLLFAFSSLSSTIAVPSSRSLKFITDENISTQHLYDEFQTEGRMDVEVADYSGTGANNHHDPKPPPGSL
ncbi:hypothetical protein CDL12_15730 [Handroanthus impetiginosus]|uniref:Transmembrane protein n=1 Tax=Handroanthus impetiginosus TaxID=429701 RepID=A0A2G9H2C0_9LAMI|nr:hypothetical protein CDL12_15730 [Handroanthus impetiginosus]